MKNIITLSIIFLSFINCTSQRIVPLETPYETTGENHYYRKDVNNLLLPFIGTWLWEDDNSSFEITLQKFEMVNYSPNYLDQIFGKYTYIENGIEIASVDVINPVPDFVISLTHSSPTTFNIIVVDVSTTAYKVGEFTLLSDNTATMILRTSEGSKPNYVGSENFSLPTNITLTKQ